MKKSNESTKSFKTSLFGGPSIKKTLSNSKSQSDLIYLTTRLIVLGETNASIETIRVQLDEIHRSSYQIFSLDQYFPSTQTHRDKFSPSLLDLLNFCQKVFLYLIESSTNIVVLYSLNGKFSLPMISCSLMALGKLFPTIDQIIQFYEFRRCSTAKLTNSQKKYVQYLADIAFGLIDRPHFNEIHLKSISFSPIPTFNRQKNGCRPFVDIFTDDQKKICSTYSDPSKLRNVLVTDQIGSIQLNLSLQGDFIVRLSHAPNGLSFQATDGGIRICQLRFNSNFATKNQREVFYSKNEIETYDSTDRLAENFRLTFECVYPENAESKINDPQNLRSNFDKILQTSFLLFRDQKDSQNQLDVFLKQMKTDVVFRPMKSREDFSLSSSFNSMTSSGQSQRFSTSSNPSSPSSFVSPFHNPLKNLSETKSVPSVIERSISSEGILKQTNSIPTSKNLLEENLLNLSSPSPSNSNQQIPMDEVETKTSESSGDSTEEKNIPQEKNDLLDFEWGENPIPSKTKPLTEISQTNSSILKVREWTEGKKRNIRALLCSLSSVVWTECGWKGCQMHELVTVDQVKKAYRKAVLHIHPDKLRDDPNEDLAKLIFVELNEAWSQFDRENR